MASKIEGWLKKAVDAGRETKSIEFKAQFDVQSKQDWCELLKDFVAMANSGGGAIFFGMSDDGATTRADLSAVSNLDPATIADKIHSYTNTNFAEFQIGIIKKRNVAIAFINIGAASVPLVFTRPGTYGLADGKQATAFSKGTVYYRHGAKSEPGTSDDLRHSFERELKAARREWMSGVRKLVNAPSGAEVSILPPKGRRKSAHAAKSIQIVTDPSAPAYRLVNPDEQYPYRQKELIAAVLKGLPNASRLNSFDVLCIRKVYKVDQNRAFFYSPLFGSPQYSSSFADWIIKQAKKDDHFFETVRRSVHAND